MADAGATRRVELVETSSPEGAEAGRTGLGLVIGLVVGRSSLIGAATGSERFEVAVAHFVGVVLASVAGVLLLGVIYDQATRRSPVVEAPGWDAPEVGAAGRGTHSELPAGMPT